MNHPLCTIHGRYRLCGINPCGGGRGIVDTQEVPYCNGMEVRIRADTGSRTLSLNSHIRPRSLNDIRAGTVAMPLCWGEDDKIRMLTKGEICSVMGNAAGWKDIEGNGTVEVDTMWRSTPVVLWKKIPNEVFGTYDAIDVSASFDYIPCGELREEEIGCPRVECLEEMGMRPPASDYQSHRKYSIGSTESVSAEETEEREGKATDTV